MFGRHNHEVGNCTGGERRRGEGGKGEGGRGEGVIEGDTNVSMYMAQFPNVR